MKTKLFFQKISTYAFLIMLFTATFSSIAQFNQNDQFIMESSSTNQRASIEFTARISIGCCGGQSNYTFSIQNGVRFEAETAMTEFLSRVDLVDFQKWRFINLGNNIVQIVNVRSSRAIDVSSANAVPTQQDINASDRGQQWRAVRLNGNNYRFVSVLTGKAISVNSSNGRLVQRNVRNRNRAQMWRLTSVARSPLGDPDEVFQNLTIAPNPASDQTTLIIDSNFDDPNAVYEVKERGFIDKIRKTISLKRGRNEIPIDISTINEGLSVVIIFINGRQTLAKNLFVNR